ncbi:hypothetical protein [Flavobacterium sp. ACN6]|uniref:hypothetical protein n=1 Tax=Flavobacterium sp. ACN6 TaxID=1920426 RepID=UPI000BB3654B|nr:hypothetical protein [Flavobacterium sp. ACN6]PBJ15898.1 hypothetical protein BSF42_03020 [Flavobacterium sp. ACN6]
MQTKIYFEIKRYLYKSRAMLLLLYCIFPIICFSQQKYSPKVVLAVETYAFLKGQSASLEHIAKQFPSLKSDIKTAEKKSSFLHSRAEQNIELFLKQELPEQDFIVLQNRIDSLLIKQFNIPIEKEQHARDFLEIIKDRPHSLKDTVLSKGIISFAYQDKPHQEIVDGHIETFTTKDHPKASDSDLQISVPKSWLAEEAAMSQTVQQFTSFHGRGNEKILLLVYDLPADEQFVLNEKSAAELLPPQANLIRTESVRIDGIPAVMIDVEEAVHEKAKVRMLQFMFTKNRKLYCLQGSIGPVESSKNLDLHIQKYEPLFRMIASKTQIEK